MDKHFYPQICLGQYNLCVCACVNYIKAKGESSNSNFKKKNTELASETATRQLKNAHLTHLLVGKNQKEHHNGP